MASDADNRANICCSKFGTIAKFDPIDNDQKICTERFLAACTEVTSILDDLGSGFSFPKKDMLGNIKKIQDRYNVNPEKYSVLNTILEEDSAAKKKPTVTVGGIIWLRRGLDFLRAFLANLSQEFHDKILEEGLRPTVLKAYETTLKPFHGSMVQFLVSNTFRLVPYRSTFLKTLATDPSVTPEMVISDIDKYLVNFSATIDCIQSLLDKLSLDLKLTA